MQCRIEVLRFHFLLDLNPDPESQKSWISDSGSGSRAGIVKRRLAMQEACKEIRPKTVLTIHSSQLQEMNLHMIFVFWLVLNHNSYQVNILSQK